MAKKKKYKYSHGGSHTNTGPTVKNWDNLLLKQRWVESRFNPYAESRKKATGSAQITPNTLTEAIRKGWAPKGTTVDDLKGPEGYGLSLQIQDSYMQDLYERSWNKGTDEVRKAKSLLAYNYGPTATVKKLNKLKNKGIDIYNSTDFVNYFNKESREYQKKIMEGLSTKKDPFVQTQFEALKDVTPLLKKYGGNMKKINKYNNGGDPPKKHKDYLQYIEGYPFTGWVDSPYDYERLQNRITEDSLLLQGSWFPSNELMRNLQINREYRDKVKPYTREGLYDLKYEGDQSKAYGGKAIRYAEDGGKFPPSKIQSLIDESNALKEELAYMSSKEYLTGPESIYPSAFDVNMLRNKENRLKELTAQIRELQGAGGGSIQQATIPSGERLYSAFGLPNNLGTYSELNRTQKRLVDQGRLKELSTRTTGYKHGGPHFNYPEDDTVAFSQYLPTITVTPQMEEARDKEIAAINKRRQDRLETLKDENIEQTIARYDIFEDLFSKPDPKDKSTWKLKIPIEKAKQYFLGVEPWYPETSGLFQSDIDSLYRNVFGNYKYGGKSMDVDYEAEGGEVVIGDISVNKMYNGGTAKQYKGAKMFKLGGPSHADGGIGIKMNGEEPSYVFTDRLKVGGMKGATYADMASKFGNELDEISTMAMGGDVYDRNTAKLMKPRIMEDVKDLFNDQEEFKKENNIDQEPDKAFLGAAFGSLAAGAGLSKGLAAAQFLPGLFNIAKGAFGKTAELEYDPIVPEMQEYQDFNPLIESYLGQQDRGIVALRKSLEGSGVSGVGLRANLQAALNQSQNNAANFLSQVGQMQEQSDRATDRFNIGQRAAAQQGNLQAEMMADQFMAQNNPAPAFSQGLSQILGTATGMSREGSQRGFMNQLFGLGNTTTPTMGVDNSAENMLALLQQYTTGDMGVGLNE